MPDPITLSVIGTVALAEGIKFLYSQAGEVLKRWRDRRNESEKNAEESSQIDLVKISLPEVFEGQLSEPAIHFDVVERLAPQLRAVRQELSSYAEETDLPEPTDDRLLTKVDALRQMMEAIYQQRITFRGEQRPASGTIVEGGVDVEKVEGYVAAVQAGTIKGGHLIGNVKAKEVTSGGTVIGVKVDTAK